MNLRLFSPRAVFHGWQSWPWRQNLLVLVVAVIVAYVIMRGLIIAITIT